MFEDNERALAASGENPTPGREQLERDGILFVERDSYVGSVFPDFYHTTFHAPWYVFERWGAVFTIRGYLPRGSLSHQDLVVLERPLDYPPHPRPVHARPGGAAPTPASAEPLGAHDPAPLERVSAELARGVVPRSPSRFGAPGELARRAVLRALRPYTSLERGLDRDLAEAVAATDRRTEELERALDANAAVARMSPLVHDVLNRHSERIKRLDAELQAELERLSDRVERLEGSGGP